MQALFFQGGTYWNSIIIDFRIFIYLRLGDMNRRDTVKILVQTTTCLSILPAWAQGWSREDLLKVKSCFNPKEEALLSGVADTIIPAGQENIGALSLGVDQFLNRLFSDCYQADIQENIKIQLNQIDKKALKDYRVTFNQCTTPQKLSILEQLACSDDSEVQDTWKLIKSETIRGFRTSKKVMTEYLDYQVMPGHFYGCIQVNS
jgi:hypothetical protein